MTTKVLLKSRLAWHREVALVINKLPRKANKHKQGATHAPVWHEVGCSALAQSVFCSHLQEVWDDYWSKPAMPQEKRFTLPFCGFALALAISWTKLLCFNMFLQAGPARTDRNIAGTSAAAKQAHLSAVAFVDFQHEHGKLGRQLSAFSGHAQIRPPKCTQKLRTTYCRLG